MFTRLAICVSFSIYFDQFSSYNMVKEVEEFFATRTKPTIVRTLKQSIERVQINARWVESIQKEEHLAKLVQELASK